MREIHAFPDIVTTNTLKDSILWSEMVPHAMKHFAQVKKTHN